MTSFDEQAKQIHDEFVSSLNNEDRQITGGAMEKLLASDFGAQALNVGDTIPQFSLPNAQGDVKAIYDYFSQGPVVLSFYRGGWCPFCNLEFKALSDILPAIKAKGASLVGISPELPEVAQQTVNNSGLKFDVLSDVGNEITRLFGLHTVVFEEMRPLYLKWGLDVPAHNGDDRWEIPIPATYVADKQGKIRSAYVNKDYTQRMEPEDILKALDAL